MESPCRTASVALFLSLCLSLSLVSPLRCTNEYRLNKTKNFGVCFFSFLFSFLGGVRSIRLKTHTSNNSISLGELQRTGRMALQEFSTFKFYFWYDSECESYWSARVCATRVCDYSKQVGSLFSHFVESLVVVANILTLCVPSQ